MVGSSEADSHMVGQTIHGLLSPSFPFCMWAGGQYSNFRLVAVADPEFIEGGGGTAGICAKILTMPTNSIGPHPDGS